MEKLKKVLLSCYNLVKSLPDSDTQKEVLDKMRVLICKLNAPMVQSELLRLKDALTTLDVNEIDEDDVELFQGILNNLYQTIGPEQNGDEQKEHDSLLSSESLFVSGRE